MTLKKILFIITAAVVALSLTAGGAGATRLITGHDIKDGTIRLRDLGPGVQGKLEKAGQQGPTGLQGPAGKDGKDGTSDIMGLYRAQAFYDVGDTNSGAIATVACSSPTDVAISGEVQVLGIGDTQAEVDAANQRNTPVSSSFAGRMDWSTNTPKPGRYDGWVFQFGGGVAPEKVLLTVTCVPNGNVPVVRTYTESD